jgi:hypothetical protein
MIALAMLILAAMPPLIGTADFTCPPGASITISVFDFASIPGDFDGDRDVDGDDFLAWQAAYMADDPRADGLAFLAWQTAYPMLDPVDLTGVGGLAGHFVHTDWRRGHVLYKPPAGFAGKSEMWFTISTPDRSRQWTAKANVTVEENEKGG